MLRNDELSDLSLLLAISDATGTDGCASSDDIAAQLGIEANGRTRTRGGRVAMRLTWMARYGFLDKVDPAEAGVEREDKHRLWRITEGGNALLKAKLSRPVETAIEKMKPGDQVLMMRELTSHAFRANGVVSNAVRREYLHQQAASRR